LQIAQYLDLLENGTISSELAGVYGLLIEGLSDASSDPGKSNQAANLITVIPRGKLDVLAQKRAAELSQLASRTTLDSSVYLLKKRGTNPSENICLGRGRRNDVVIDSSVISTLHAYFEPDESKGSYLIQDANSSNGTFLNGQRLGHQQQFPISSGDCIRLGALVLYYLSSSRFIEFMEHLKKAS